ncbi:MAG: TRAP transporter permease [Firmicutes bacterium]|jgi:TRAP transporter 4TM/12TM fusion protein|nr:TRAP transporter permease [Bacillota bacterium]
MGRTPETLGDIATSGKRHLPRWLGGLVFTLAMCYSVFNLVVLVFVPVGPWIHLPVNLAFASVLTLLAYTSLLEKRKTLAWVTDIILVAAAIACTSYYALEYNQMVWRIGAFPTTPDVVFAAITILVSLEITRRASGSALALVGIGFLAYGLLGQHIPGFLGHSGFALDRVITYMYSDTGIFGTALSAASSYVFLFILFGAFLEKLGGGQVFIDLATGVAGHARGGPAKVAVLSSALFGTISGSSVANVAATGAFTIPLMKRIGYKPHFAGGVEAAASTGGQIMPPVMGSTAFILAEIVGVSYSVLAIKAMFPAILYFLAVLIMVDLEAIRMNLRGMPRAELPDPLRILRDRWGFLVPIVVIFVSLLVFRVSTSRAAVLGIVTTLIGPMLTRGVKLRWRSIPEAVSNGAMGVLNIVASCTTAGIIIGVLAMTGLGLKIGTVLVKLSGGNLFLLLVAAMVLSMMLGMGLPTAAAYIIAASVVGPALTQAGVPMFTAHLFIFYFSLLAMVTPPVALASYTAAGIAGASPAKVGWAGLKLSIAAFIVPYMFVYGPALILEGPVLQVAYSLVTAVIGVILLGAAVEGHAYVLGRLNMAQRALLLAAAIVTMLPGAQTDAAGLALVAIAVVLRGRAPGQHAAAARPGRQ